MKARISARTPDMMGMSNVEKIQQMQRRMAEEAAKSEDAGRPVFRNLMREVPPPPPPPAPPPKYEPVRPSVEPVQAGVEPSTVPSVESKVEAVRAGVEPVVRVHDPSVPEKRNGRQPMFTANDLRRNFVVTEILGKPVALRRK